VDLTAPAPTQPHQAIVIGAGLAGCFTAAALVRRGFEVTVIESGEVAGAASGNLQGVLYTRLSRRHSALTDFALTSFLYAARYYRDMFDTLQLTDGIDGSLCGMFQQMSDFQEMEIMADALAHLPELAQVLDAASASSLLGIRQHCAGYWFPHSGWLNPQAVCRALLTTPGISVIDMSGDVALTRKTDQWWVSQGGRTIASAPYAVIAAGIGSTAFDACHWLPTRAIRGQTTQLAAHSEFSDLRAALCHSGYIAPATTQGHCIGASFHPEDMEVCLRTDDASKNIDRLAQAIPDWAPTLAALAPGHMTGRVGWRCASPDYLPLVGPVPDLEPFKTAYSELRRNARHIVAEAGPYLPGLYLNTGHGSRGLSSAPLAADVLASQISGEPPPLERTLSRALAPARFIIRDLARNRI
jgi:tRNA 5-methylaminomethyl-2-thiouridine biosynthesis bifunctional protein